MTVEIRAFRGSDDPESSVIAEIDAFLPKMSLHLRRCRLIRTKTGGSFVGLPSYKDVNDEWVHYYEFEGSIQKKLATEILEAVQPLLTTNEEADQLPAPTAEIPF